MTKAFNKSNRRNIFSSIADIIQSFTMSSGSGKSSLLSSTSSSSISTPTTPLTATKLQYVMSRQKTPSIRREVVSAPAAFDLPHPYSQAGSSGRKSSSESFNSSPTSEAPILKPAKRTTKKRKGAAVSTGSSPIGCGFDISYRNIYTTTDRNGRARVGSGSGPPAGCSLM